jgi:hypothetical protein
LGDKMNRNFMQMEVFSMSMPNIRSASYVAVVLMIVATGGQVARPSPVQFTKVVIDKTFRSEGVAVGDVNRDGLLDILAGEVWYEAPHWKMHEILPPGKYDGATGYSKTFANFACGRQRRRLGRFDHHDDDGRAGVLV